MIGLRWRWGGLILVIAAVLAGPARGAAVDLKLVLAVDTSSSVNYEEFGLQMRGLAAAFKDERVVRAIEAAGERGIAVCLMQWAGTAQQTTAINWVHIRDADSAHRFSGVIQATPRLFPVGSTDLGGAIDYGAHLIGDDLFAAPRRAIDISGDGRASAGVEPALRRDEALRTGITVNGLAILSEEPDLEGYYLSHVTGGPASFVVVADDYGDFAEAMVRKLVREIIGGAMVRSPGETGPRTLTASTIGEVEP